MAKANEKSPAFRFYAGDFLADENVMAMSLEERGAYITALCIAWNQGSIPADPERLSRLLKDACERTVRVVIDCFVPDRRDPSRLINPRLEKERSKQQKQKQFASEAGKKSARFRWGSEPKSAKPEVSNKLDDNVRYTSVTESLQRNCNLSFSLSPSEGLGLGRLGETPAQQETLNRKQTPPNANTSLSVIGMKPHTPVESEGHSGPADRILIRAEELTGVKIRKPETWEKQKEKVYAVLTENSEEEILKTMTAAMKKPLWQEKVLGEGVKLPPAMLVCCLPQIMDERSRRDFVKPVAQTVALSDNSFVENSTMDFCELCGNLFSGREMQEHMQTHATAGMVH
jgi:uncharacterized protein YdaU (DUF1376 family)